MTRSQRVRRGFHRIAIVLSAPWLAFAGYQVTEAAWYLAKPLPLLQSSDRAPDQKTGRFTLYREPLTDAQLAAELARGFANATEASKRDYTQAIEKKAYYRARLVDDVPITFLAAFGFFAATSVVGWVVTGFMD